MSSLVMICTLSGRYDKELGSVFVPTAGHIRDLGFCDLDGTLSHRPPQPDKLPYDGNCQGRFFSLALDDSSESIGSVKVAEDFVYDYMARGDIDFTGFRVTISLRRDAYDAYLNYIGKVKQPGLTDQVNWDGYVYFRMPSEPFVFPMPRGSSSPWQTGGRIVGQLKPIKRFVFDEIEIQVLPGAQRYRANFDDIPREERSGWRPPLSLGASRKAVP